MIENKAKAIEQRRRAGGIETFQDQLQSEGRCANLHRQFRYDDHTLSLHCVAALNTWDVVEE